MSGTVKSGPRFHRKKPSDLHEIILAIGPNGLEKNHEPQPTTTTKNDHTIIH